jgi:hypothetical protein
MGDANTQIGEPPYSAHMGSRPNDGVILLQYVSVVMGNRPAATVPSLLWCPSSNGCVSPIATLGHMTDTRLLLPPTSATGTLTSRTVATMGHVAHARLLLAPTAAMNTMTSVDRCYCSTGGTRTVAASTHISDRHSDISGPLLLLEMWHTHYCC